VRWKRPSAMRVGQFSNGEEPITAYRNTVLIYNPRAGRLGRGGRALLTRAVEVLTKNGHTVTVVPTTGPKTAGAMAREHIERGADLIVAAGGDGTINEVADGMVFSEVPLAILPAGTANVLAMEIRIGSKMERAAEMIEASVPYRISAGHLTCADGSVSRYFLLMAGAGLDAHIASQVNAAVKARLGKLAYWLAGWRVLGRDLPLFDVEANGQKFRCSFALLSKVRNYGGDFAIAQDVTLFDDEFEMVLFEGRSTFRYLKYFAGLLFNRHRGMTGVTVMRTAEAQLSGPVDVQVYTQIDGEVAGHLPAEVKIVPAALTLLIPPEYRKHVR
jgi:diacylglycerol kinase (ATP)